MTNNKILLNKTVFESGSIAYLISDDIINECYAKKQTPQISLKEEDIKELCPEYNFNIKKPVIGALMAREGDNFSFSRDYTKVLLKAGAEIRFITYDHIEEQMQDIDGLTMPGGYFDSPIEWYNNQELAKDCKPGKRSFAYISCINEAQNKNLPILGLCGGMQMLTGMYAYEDGFRMYKNIANETNSKVPHSGIPAKDLAHEITIMKDSKLYQIIGDEKLMVNSMHNEAFMYSKTSNNTHVKVSAIGPDDTVEAVEIVNYPTFAIGVQFHPETLASHGNETMQKIFNAFVVAAGNYQKTKS